MTRTLYNKLRAVLPNLDKLETGITYRYRASGFMDLVVEVLWTTPDRAKLSLAHYYEQNGDLMRDPEMEVLVVHGTATFPGAVQACTYRQDGLGIFQESRLADGRIRPRLAREHDAFLRIWLTNLRAQGHKPVPKGAA